VHLRQLTDRERAVLDFERAWPPGRRGKRDAVAAALGISASRYYQVLAALLDLPAARAHDPLLVTRLRRRRRDRTAGSAAAAPVLLAQPDQGSRDRRAHVGLRPAPGGEVTTGHSR
jgi:hypothetical protein